mgnify:CR=1 FL=1
MYEQSFRGIEYPGTDEMPVSELPFSPVVKVGSLLFVSGQASVDGAGTIVEGSFEEEVRRSFNNLKAVLESAGSDLKHLVQTRNYVRDGENVKRFNEIYREIFEGPYPARTTLTGCLGRIQFEVECIAVVKEEA